MQEFFEQNDVKTVMNIKQCLYKRDFAFIFSER